MKTNIKIEIFLAVVLSLLWFTKAQGSVNEVNNTQESLLNYCASNGASTYWEYIDYVAIGTIARTSGAETGGYYDGTALSTDVVVGSTYNVTYSHANPHGGYVEDWSVYIDYNADGDFYDTGETVFNATTYTAGNYTTAITIPSTATIGSTRMRVSMGFQYNGFPPPCGTFPQGEVEDYTINITGGGSTCIESYEPNDKKGNAVAIALNTDIISQISTATDLDWFKFSNSTSEPNIKITLTSLPANYNIKLFNPSGVAVKTSAKTGTADETITYNTAIVGTWKVKVFGANGAYSNTQCYTLKAIISNTPFKLLEGNDFASVNSIEIYPVPATDLINLTFISEIQALARLTIFNAMGQIVFVQAKQITEGENKFAIQIGNLASGIYWVELSGGNLEMRREFVVTK